MFGGRAVDRVTQLRSGHFAMNYQQAAHAALNAANARLCANKRDRLSIWLGACLVPGQGSALPSQKWPVVRANRRHMTFVELSTVMC
jgi:hypothetical protein